MIFTPVKISFVDDNEFPVWDIIDYCVACLFFVDAVLQFFVAFYNEDKGKWEVEFKSIAINYLKFWFIIDITSIFPFDQVFQTNQFAILLRISKLPRLYRLAKVAKFVRGFRSARSQNNLWSYIHDLFSLNPGVTRMLTIIVCVMLSCHIGACIWHYLPQITDDPVNWITLTGNQDSSGYQRYLTSLYWVTQTVKRCLTLGHYCWIW